MFHRLGAFVTRHWLLVILAWLAAGGALHYVAPRWDDVTLDGDLEYLPADCGCVRAERLLARAFPNLKAKSQIAVVIERPDGPLNAADDAVIVDLHRALCGEFADVLPARLRPDAAAPSGGANRAAAGEDSAGQEPLITEIWCPVALSAHDNGQAAIAEEIRSPVTEQGQAALIVLHLRNEFMAVGNMQILDRVLALLDSFRARQTFPQHLRLGVAGSAAIGSDMLSAAAQSIKSTETVTVVLVLLILLLVYRAPMLAFIPLTVMFVSTFVATDIIALLADASRRTDWYTFKVFKTTKIFLVTILFGSGTDYCLFLISRYREELGAGLERGQALARSIGQTGVALAASALTTVLGLGMLFFADFGKFRYAGPSLALAVSVVLLASLTLAPALLKVAGNMVFWPFGARPITEPPLPPLGKGGSGGAALGKGGRRRRHAPLMTRMWGMLSQAIIARPGVILAGSFLLLLPLGWYGYAHVDTTYDLVSELGPERPSVQGTAMLRKHFPAGATGPVSLVAYHPRADFRSRQDRSNEDQVLIRDLTKYLASIEGVQRVRSWYTPFGEPRKRQSAAQQAARRSLAEERYVSQNAELDGRVIRVQLELDQDPFSPASRQRLEHLRSCLDNLSGGELPPGVQNVQLLGEPLDQAWRGTQFELAGTTAATSDLRAVTTSDNTRIQILCTLAVWAVMLVLLRRPLICTYLILSVLFTYLVSLGATHLVFQLALGESFVGLDWKVPLFLFVILVAVGADYNIYLVTRVFEEQRRLGPLAGLREAVVRTGGIISSCGIIMVGSFLSMMSGTLHAILELGFALSLGIILDTFVVRPILVPAFLAMLCRWRLKRQSAAEYRETRHRDEPADALEQVPELVS